MRDPRAGLHWPRARAERRALDYMASRTWFERRQRWLQLYTAASGQEPGCAVCGAPWRLDRGDLHHRTYARLGRERWQDFVPMCRRCHRLLHRLMERNAAWRRLPRHQATDLLIAYLRTVRRTTRGVSVR